MIRTQIYIPEHLHQTAKNIAERKSEALAKFLRRVITRGVEHERKNIQGKSLSSLAKLNITGGPKNLSRNVDKYLYDK